MTRCSVITGTESSSSWYAETETDESVSTGHWYLSHATHRKRYEKDNFITCHFWLTNGLNYKVTILKLFHYLLLLFGLLTFPGRNSLHKIATRFLEFLNERYERYFSYSKASFILISTYLNSWINWRYSFNLINCYFSITTYSLTIGPMNKNDIVLITFV